MPRWRERVDFVIGDRRKAVRECVDWGIQGAEGCRNLPAPEPILTWENCALGSSPWGKDQNNRASLCFGQTRDFPCKFGYNCYIHVRDDYDTSLDSTRFNDEREGCWGLDKIKYKICHDWNNGDPNSCQRKAEHLGLPVKGWIKCGIGSSPDGKEPNHGAMACSPMSTTINCERGQNCFAVTDIQNGKCNPTRFGDERTGCWDKDEISYKKCLDWANNDPQECLRKAQRDGLQTQGWIKCGVGSSPDGKEPGDGAKTCSPMTSDFDCAWGQSCFAVTRKNPNKCATTKFSDERTTCIDGTEVKFRGCWDWHNNDPKSCNELAESKLGFSPAGWIKCAIGSSPNGIEPNASATLCGGVVTAFPCVAGENCYAVTSSNERSTECNAKYTSPVQGCARKDTGMTSVECTDWVNGDPASCFTSVNKPAQVLKWQTCALGSSPGGSHPGKGAIACSEPNSEFNCVWGQGCFAILDENQDESCENLLDPLDVAGGITSTFDNLKWYLVAMIVLCVACSFSAGVASFFV